MDSKPVEFLRAILPDQGWYAAWTKVSKTKSYNRFFRTIEELAVHIAMEDALGRTVYHACATFKDPKGVWNERKKKFEKRCQQNVWGVKAFWFDIEAGDDGDSYPGISSAVDAVARFCQSTALPQPLLVSSGGGVHCYWPLSEALCLADWQDYAQGLKRAAYNFGLVVDPSRTADAASVLRTPGTHNRKYEPQKDVVAGALEGPYDVSDFDHLLGFGSAVVGTGVLVPVSRSVAVPASPLTQALIVKPDYGPTYADGIADQCAQIRQLRDQKGCTPEPHWYACLGVLAFCTDGEAKAHEWSSGHPDYTYEETQDKLERTRALTGATTCAKFEGVNPAGCEGCPLRGRITSPVSASFTTTTPEGRRELHDNILPGRPESISVPDNPDLPLLPSPFAFNDNQQLVQLTEDKKGGNSEILISNYPLHLVGVGVGEVRGDRFSFHFRQWLPKRGWSDLHIEAGKLVGSTGHSEITARGCTIHDFKVFLAYVRTAVDTFHATEQLKMHFDQCGWKNDYAEFLIGNCLYNADGVDENVTCTSELSTRVQWLGPQTGSLDQWSAAANSLFAVGCEAQSFALACSFAAPLMRLQASDEGGAVVNLVSRGSGTGKTTALAAVSSAWGKEQGLSLTNSDTRVAKAITLGVLSNLPIVYDELGNRDPQVIRDFIVMFTNGRDKMRGNAEGTINHTKAGWQTLLISSSNLSIYDLLASMGGTDAPSFRVFEAPCKLPENVVPARGDKLRKALQANAGWAGDAYVDYLVQPGVMPWVREELEKWTGMLWDKAGGRPEHRFWMRTIGAVAVASAIVNRLDILEFQSSRIVEWALDRVKGYGGEQVTTGQEQRSSISALGEFLGEHVNTVLVVPDAFHHGVRTKMVPITKPNQHVYARYEIKTNRLLISRNVLTTWLLKKEIGSRELLADLSEARIVTEVKRYATLTAGTDLVGSQQPCVEIDASHPAISGMLQMVTPLAANDARAAE